MASTSRAPLIRAFTLPLRPVSSPAAQSTHSSTQTRHASSARRHKKLHNIPPAPSTLFPNGASSTPTGSKEAPSLPLGGSSGRSRTARDPLPKEQHILFNPPSSVPNPYHTPPKFLPKDDIRWRLHEEQQAQVEALSGVKKPKVHPSQAWNPPGLPPPVRPPYQKKYHLTPEDIELMRKLREEDEDRWTLTQLAERFQCSRFFCRMVTKCSDERGEMLRRQEEAWVATWWKRGAASPRTRELRRRRRENWTYEI